MHSAQWLAHSKCTINTSRCHNYPGMLNHSIFKDFIYSHRTMLPYVHPSPATLVLVLLFEQIKYVCTSGQVPCGSFYLEGFLPEPLMDASHAFHSLLKYHLFRESFHDNLSKNNTPSQNLYHFYYAYSFFIQFLELIFYILLYTYLWTLCPLEFKLTKVGNFIALFTFLPSVSGTVHGTHYVLITII